MFFLQVRAVHMCVDLGRRDVRMAEHFLDGRKVCSVLEKVRGKRMPESVRSHVAKPTPGRPSRFDMASDDFPRSGAAERSTVVVQEDHAL